MTAPSPDPASTPDDVAGLIERADIASANPESGSFGRLIGNLAAALRALSPPHTEAVEPVAWLMAPGTETKVFLGSLFASPSASNAMEGLEDAATLTRKLHNCMGTKLAAEEAVDAMEGEIERLTKERDTAHRLELIEIEAETAAEARAEAAEALVKLLAEALEPFGRADRAIGDEPGPFRFETASGHRVIEREDLRRAAAALDRARTEGKLP